MALLFPTSRRRTRLLTTFLAATALVAACADGSKSPVAPELPGPGPAQTALKPVAFIADIDRINGTVKITAPSSSTVEGAQLGLAGALGLPDLSLLGGEAVRLIPSNFQASAVGAFTPGKVRVQFDIVIENKLPGINFITPTWPTPPAPGVILVPLETHVTTTPGGVTGGDGNEVIVELPSYGLVEPSIDWSGTGTAGSGAPFSFFNDTNCGLATSNDCFRWEAYTSPVLSAPSTSEARNIGFDIDPTVGQFRARMIVAADLAPSAPAEPATIQGSITSPARGALEGVTVNVQGGYSDASDASGAYSITGVAPGTRTITLSTLPGGCTTPAAQSVAVGAGDVIVSNFSVDCTGLPGTISGVVRRSNDNSVLSGVTVVASGGGSDATDAAGAYSIAGVPAGSGTLSVTGAPAECSAISEPYTLVSGGSITEDLTLACTAPPQPGYAYRATWTSLPGNEYALELRIDMRTFNRADIDDITTGAATGDPLTGAHMIVQYDATRLAYVPPPADESRTEAPTAPSISAAPTVNASTPGQVNVLNSTTTLKTGDLGIVRLVFARVAGSSAGSVTTVTSLQSAASRSGGVTRDITADVRINEGTLVLP